MLWLTGGENGLMDRGYYLSMNQNCILSMDQINTKQVTDYS